MKKNAMILREGCLLRGMRKLRHPTVHRIP